MKIGDKYRLILALVFLLLPSITNSQKVEWAGRVILFSSQAGEKLNAAKEIIGEPSVMPDFGSSVCAWSPMINPDIRYEWITVGFDNPINASQISISENINPGSIYKIFLYDSLDREHLVYYKPNPKRVSETGRMTNILFQRTDYRVYSAKIIVNTQYSPGAVIQIDAVGISDSEQPVSQKIRIVKGSDLKYQPENLGLDVNSPYNELAPVISPDGKTLFFTREGHPDNIGKKKEQDVWYSRLKYDNTFSEAVNIGPPINNEENNFTFSISPDGNSLLLGNVYNPEGNLTKGVSISYYQGEKWSYPQKIFIRNFYNKNKSTGYFLANDQKTLLMSIEREDTQGGLDLYVSFLQKDGTWSIPKNMGPIVNTADDDSSPFLAADGVTLYYSTGGHPGFGNNDIFMTKRLDDSWTKWSIPENLGSGLNSPGWDAYFTITASGEYGYFVSTKKSYGNEDIFRVILPEGLKPSPVVLIEGKVLRSTNNEPLDAKIIYETLPDGVEAGIARSNPKTGEYKIVLPAGKRYGFLAVADSFLAVNENLDARNITRYTEISRDLFLVPIREGEIVRLNNIFFEFGKYNLLEESFAELNRMVKFMRDRKNIKIELAGHTDDVGTIEDNLILSRNRANAVADYLTTHGIDPSRLSVVGYGKGKPVATNETASGRQKNRRVEFVIKH